MVFIRESGCIPAKVVGFGQRGCIRSKLVVFVKIGCIREGRLS